MSTVRKTCYVNPIEPGPLSFRAGSRVETRLEVTFFQQNGNAYTTDLDAQLRLTSRSGMISRAYSMPAIDVANGKVRAVLPAGDITDVNGYRLAIYGTVAGEAGLLAQGTVWPDDTVEPLAAPIDVIDTVPITLSLAQPTDSAFTVRLWDDATKTDPYDIGSSVVAAAVLDSQGGAKLVDMTVVPVASNAVVVSLTPAQVALLPASCWWTLTIGVSGGTTTLVEGPVTVA
jgi:hypothetical protein